MKRNRDAFFMKKKSTKNIQNKVDAPLELYECLTNYMEESSNSMEEIDIGEEKIEDIKTDFLKLSRYFILNFDEFRNTFKNSKNQTIIEYTKKITSLSIEAVSLTQYANSDIEFGKSESKQKLNSFVEKNYYELIDFINLCKVLSE